MARRYFASLATACACRFLCLSRSNHPTVLTLEAGNGDPEPTAATPTASAAPATTPTPAPTVSPATGLRLKEETSSVRAPKGVKMLSKDRKPMRLPNVELDGSPAYVIRYSEPGLPGVSYDIVTLHDGHSVVVNIILGKTSQHAKIVKSV